MKMWDMGRERNVPKGADLEFSCQGTNGSQYGGWFRVRKNGQWVGLAFKPGYTHVQAESSRSITVIRDIEPFVNIAVDGKVVGGRRQKREMMRAHGLVEAGDIKAEKPKPTYDPKAHQRAVVHSLKRALHHHGLGD